MTEKQYYREKAISSSSLKWFEYSPKYFKKRLEEEIADEKKSFLELGKKVHMAILEPEVFEKNYIYLEYQQPKSPNQKLFCETYVQERKKHPKSTKISCKLKAYKKAYKAGNKDDGELKKDADKLYRKLKDYIDYLEKSEEYKEVLSKADWDKINELKEEVYNHKKAPEVLALNKTDIDTAIKAYSELDIYWTYPEEYEGAKIHCKSMLDRVVVDEENKEIRLVDIKTTSNIGEFNESFGKFKYYRQLSFYWMALYSAIKNGEIEIQDSIDNYTKSTYLVVLQTRDLPECRVYEIPENVLDEGLEEIEELIPEIAWHISNDLWNHTKEYYEGSGIEKL